MISSGGDSSDKGLKSPEIVDMCQYLSVNSQDKENSSVGNNIDKLKLEKIYHSFKTKKEESKSE